MVTQYFKWVLIRIVYDVEPNNVRWIYTKDISTYTIKELKYVHFNKICESSFKGHYFKLIDKYGMIENEDKWLPIEEWLKDQGMTCVEDDMCLFELTWV